VVASTEPEAGLTGAGAPVRHAFLHAQHPEQVQPQTVRVDSEQASIVAYYVDEIVTQARPWLLSEFPEVAVSVEVWDEKSPSESEHGRIATQGQNHANRGTETQRPTLEMVVVLRDLPAQFECRRRDPRECVNDDNSKAVAALDRWETFDL